MNTKKYRKNQNYKDECESIGVACGRWRKEHRFTQIQIARDINICASEISRFESGERDSARILAWYIVKGMRGVDLCR